MAAPDRPARARHARPGPPGAGTARPARLTAIPGIGAVDGGRGGPASAYGDPDVVSVGDYHIPHHVVFALTGAVRAGARDARPAGTAPPTSGMLELLEPFRGQRGGSASCSSLGTPGPPRFGPRHAIRSFARY